MVEMRWVERIEKLAEAMTLEGAKYDIGNRVKVLQYRYFVGPINEKTLLTEFHGWSGWIDVPTVTEPTPPQT